MALVPIIQPPIMKLLTTPEERAIEMKQLRPVASGENCISVDGIGDLFVVIAFGYSVNGMLMLGNLMKESCVVDRLSDTAQNALINIVTIMLSGGRF